jgi:hypothetical protein
MRQLTFLCVDDGVHISPQGYQDLEMQFATFWPFWSDTASIGSNAEGYSVKGMAKVPG